HLYMIPHETSVPAGILGIAREFAQHSGVGKLAEGRQIDSKTHIMPNDRATRIAQAGKKFAASLKGRVILPGDTQYSQARRVWNHAVNAYPEIIVRCANVEDIVRAIDFAHRHDLATAVRSGGHSFAG